MRDFLGEPHPSESWEVALAGCNEGDGRFYNLTFTDDGTIVDPTHYWWVHGLPGPAAAYGLEAIWKKSRDPRWHPMNRIWSHDSYWLATIQNVFETRPEKYQLSILGAPAYRLWPPHSVKPKGRPRTKPMKRGTSRGRKDLLDFETQPHNTVRFNPLSSGLTPNSCTPYDLDPSPRPGSGNNLYKVFGGTAPAL